MDEFFAFQPRHGFEKKPLTLPSPPGEGILFPIAFQVSQVSGTGYLISGLPKNLWVKHG
jgi:hypothetical protein